MSKDSHDHNKCIALFEQLSEYMDKELDEMTCKDIEAHLSRCAPCHVCLESLKRTVALCKSLDEQPVPPEFSRRLGDMIRKMT